MSDQGMSDQGMSDQEISLIPDFLIP